MEANGEIPPKDAAKIIAVFLGCCIWVWYYFGGGQEQHIEQVMQKAEDWVARDQERQYYMAKRSGTATDAYVHAGIVSAAYLQAGNEAKYKEWQAIAADESARSDEAFRREWDKKMKDAAAEAQAEAEESLRSLMSR